MEYKHKCTHCHEPNVEFWDYNIEVEEICSNCGEKDASGKVRHKDEYRTTSFVSHNKKLKKDDKDNPGNS